MTCVQADISVLYSKLNEFRLNDRYCDVNVHVNEKSFKCHRLILAAACEYFDAMFGGKFRESNTEDVDLSYLDAAAFEEVLRFVYTGKVVLSAENAYSLLFASEFLKLFSIEELCVEYIKQNIPIQNALDILVFARATNKDSLVNILNDYVITHFNSISKSESLLRLQFDEFRELLDQFQRSSLSTKNEFLLLDSIMRWTCHAHKERRMYFHELVGWVNFENISADYVEFMVKKYFSCDPDVPLQELTHYIPNQKNPLALHVFVELDHNSDNTVFSMKEENGNWNWNFSYKISSESIPKSFQSISVDNYLYCLNDFCIRNKTGNLKFFAASSVDLCSDFHILRSPPNFFSKFNMCSLRNSIYLYNCNIFDRYQGLHFDDSTFDLETFHRGIYVYNRELDKWFPVTPLKIPVADACMTTLDNSVYIIGGTYKMNASINFIRGYFQAHDSRTSLWQALPPSTNSFVNAACCIHEGKIYVSGGSHELKKTEVFDPVAGKWQQIESMNSTRKLHKLISYQNRLWAIGNDCADLSIEVYDTLVRKWLTLSALEDAVSSYKSEMTRADVLETQRSTSVQKKYSVRDAVIFKN